MGLRHLHLRFSVGVGVAFVSVRLISRRRLAAGPIDVRGRLPDNRREMPIDSDTVPVGAQAPEFTLKAANDGREVSLSGYRGRPVVLVFLRGFG